MSSDNVEVVEPSAAQFAGQSFSNTAKRLFHATRPKFFPASVLPVLIGTTWGIQASGSFSVSVFALALLATVCVHAASNVLNDVGDDSGDGPAKRRPHLSVHRRFTFYPERHYECARNGSPRY